jgi:hypothetical protein
MKVRFGVPHGRLQSADYAISHSFESRPFDDPLRTAAARLHLIPIQDTHSLFFGGQADLAVEESEYVQAR